MWRPAGDPSPYRATVATCSTFISLQPSGERQLTTAQSPLLENATRDLARFASGLRYRDIPPDVVERIKLSVLDSIGCCLFGATLPWTQKVAVLAQSEHARPVASLLGMGKKSSVSLAALVNG